MTTSTTSTATVTSKGQITIPKEIRDRLRLRPGDKIGFNVDQKGNIRVVKPIDPAALDKWMGYLKHLKGLDPDDLVREMRGE